MYKACMASYVQGCGLLALPYIKDMGMSRVLDLYEK
jgi:hypothetical protein